MSSEAQKSKAPTKSRIWILICLCVFAGLLWGANWFFVPKFVPDASKQGQFGDMFGAVNALFTALAFAGLIYTVLLQRDQLALQQEEIISSGETQQQLVEKQIAAQQELFERQKVFQEEQRKKQIEHDIKLEDLRQKFEEVVEGRRKDREKREQDLFSRNVLLAIRRELETMSEIYAAGIGRDLKILPDGQFLNRRFAFSQDYFTVFESNAVHLGKVPADHAKRIIKIYAYLRALVEGYRINNKYLELIDSLRLELEDVQRSIPNVPHDSRILLQAREPRIRVRLEANINLAIAQARNLKAQDLLLTGDVVEFVSILDGLGIQ